VENRVADLICEIYMILETVVDLIFEVYLILEAV